MDNNLFQRIKELIDTNQTIGILVSPNPTFDHMAAGLGLYLALKQMNKNVAIVCPTEPTVGISSLVGIDKVQKSFIGGNGGDLVVSFPYREGEIEKVSYNVDNGKLQIVVKAGQQGLSFNQSAVQFQQGGGGAVPSLLFFLGVADMQSLGFTKTPDMTVVNIDNAVNNTKYGDVVHVESRFTSVSEEVADFLTLLEPQIELNADTAQNLLSGILSATNDFKDGQGSYLAFEMAGILMKKGAVRSTNGAVARPMEPAMPTSNYFPPQQPTFQQPVQQPVMQPTFQQPVNTFQQPVQQPEMVQQPIQQPVEQVQQPIQVQQPVQSINQQPPSDWLMPKVYKGSTTV